jgi:predicted TIM-barrel fold metal-dependent hydrolase
MQKAGCACAVPAMIATKPSQTASIETFCRELAAQPGIVPFPSVHPRDPEALNWIERFAGQFKGIKIHPHYQGVAIDDPGVVAIVQAAGQAGLVVLVHAGQDPAFPGDMKCRPQRLANLLERVAGVNLIAAHMGGWLDWDEVLEILAGRRDLWIDTSVSLGLMAPEKALQLIETHGPDRVLFASDSPWGDPAEDRQRLETLGLDDAALEAIFYRNAETLLGLATQ